MLLIMSKGTTLFGHTEKETEREREGVRGRERGAVRALRVSR